MDKGQLLRKYGQDFEPLLHQTRIAVEAPNSLTRARNYLTAVWAHSLPESSRGAATSVYRVSWTMCPAPRACALNGACMLVLARAGRIARARDAVRLMRQYPFDPRVW